MKKESSRKHRTITDGLEILDHLYFNTPEKQRQVRQAVERAEVAQEVYALRKNAGLTQRQLAKMIGTTPSVISRLEDADYHGHSLSMLQRISSALHYKLEVRFVPIKSSARKRSISTTRY